MLLSIPERRYLPLASMTKFQARLEIRAYTQRLLERDNINKGNFSIANGYGNLATYLEQIVDNKLPSSSAKNLGYLSVNTVLNQEVDKIVRQASINGDKPAMQYVGGDYDTALASLQNTQDNDFELTSAENTACSAQARELARPFFDNRTQYLNLIDKYTRECRTKKSMEKVVNAKFVDGSSLFFGHLMPFVKKGVKPNLKIEEKAGLQNIFIRKTAQLTGLDTDLLNDIASNSLVNQMNGQSIDSTFNTLRPFMEKGATIQENTSNSLQGLPAIISIITLIVSAVKSVLSLVTQVQSLSQKTYQNILEPDLIKLVETDFNGDGIGDSKQSFFKVNSNLVGAVVSAAAGVAGGVLIKNKTARNAVIATTTVSTTYFAVKQYSRTKYWLVDGVQLTEKDLAAGGFVLHEGEWYFAEEVARRSTGNSVADILKGGKELFDTISGIFDLIKGDSANDTAIFIGNGSAVDPGDV